MTFGSHSIMLGKTNMHEIKYSGKSIDELFEEADILISKVKEGHKEINKYLQKLEKMQENGVIENFVMYRVAEKAHSLLDEAKKENKMLYN